MYFNTITYGIFVILFILIVKYVYNFYQNVKQYPSGPLPLPLIGNLMILVRNSKLCPYMAIYESVKPYGKVSTFWFGSKPAVMILDMEIGKMAFNKPEFCGRGVNLFDLIGNDFRSFVLRNYDRGVHLARKLSIEGIRNLLSTNKVSSLINEVVNEVVNKIKECENERAFSVDTYMPYISIRVSATLTFGQNYSFGDQKLETIQHSVEAFNKEIMKLTLLDLAPITKYFISLDKSNLSKLSEFNTYNQNCFEICKNAYKDGMCDNFTNSLLTARNKLIGEGKTDYVNFLTDDEIKSILLFLYIGATDSSIATVNWSILLMSHFPNIQNKLREEIKKTIDNKAPEFEDKKKFNYLNAFIMEVFRFRPIGPIGLFHKTTANVELMEYKLPKDTLVFTYIYAICNDPNYWSEPEKFIPERFLDSNGLLQLSRFPALIPFGIGKRICVGEKMVPEVLFAELVCLLQATDGYQFVLENGHQNDNLNYRAGAYITGTPNEYKVALKKD